MNKKLMLKCADHLDSLEFEKGSDGWNMMSYGRIEECGTVACAAGWLLIHGQLPDFKPVFKNSEQLINIQYLEAQDSEGIFHSVRSAVQYALKLTTVQTTALFAPHSEKDYDVTSEDCITPAMVAAKMRDMVTTS